MAAKLPDSVLRESLGSMTLLMARFSTTNIDNDDTYASGLGTSVIDQWFNATLDCTQGNEGVNVSCSAGTFTFRTGEDDVTGTLFILAQI